MKVLTKDTIKKLKYARSKRRQKSETDFVTFLSPECTRAIKLYLEYRARTPKARDPKRERQLEKQRVTPGSYLFITEKVPEKYHESHDEELRKLTTNAIFKMYREISSKTHKSTPKGHWNLVRSHNMRKYLNSALLNMGADSFFVDFLMGHEIGEAQAAYFRAQPEKLRNIYQKFIPYLTIEKELDPTQHPDFIRMKTKSEAFARAAATAAVERTEFIRMQEELEELKKLEQNIPALIQVLMHNPEAMEIMKNLKTKQ